MHTRAHPEWVFTAYCSLPPMILTTIRWSFCELRSSATAPGRLRRFFFLCDSTKVLPRRPWNSWVVWTCFLGCSKSAAPPEVLKFPGCFWGVLTKLFTHFERFCVGEMCAHGSVFERLEVRFPLITVNASGQTTRPTESCKSAQEKF